MTRTAVKQKGQSSKQVLQSSRHFLLQSSLSVLLQVVTTIVVRDPAGCAMPAQDQYSLKETLAMLQGPDLKQDSPPLPARSDAPHADVILLPLVWLP